jgi:hypothetical protein
MFELLDRDIRVGSCLLLRLDDLVQLTQLGVEPRQRRTLFLQPALRLAVLRLSYRHFGRWGFDVRSQLGVEFRGRTSVCTHLTLRDFICERFKFLAHFVNPCGGVGERLARRGDVRLHLFCIEDEHLVTEAIDNAVTHAQTKL